MNKLTKTILTIFGIIFGLLILSVIIFSVLTPKETLADNYQLGMDNYNSKNYSKALQYLNKSLKSDPTRIDAILTILDIYVLKNKQTDYVALTESYLNNESISPEDKVKIINKLLPVLKLKDQSKYLTLLNNFQSLSNDQNLVLIKSLIANKDKNRSYQLIKDTYTNLDKNSESANQIGYLWLILNLDSEQQDRSKQILQNLNQSLIQKEKIADVESVFNSIAEDTEKNSKLTHSLNIINLMSKNNLDMWVYDNFPNIESEIENYDMGNLILGIVNSKLENVSKSNEFLNKALSLNNSLSLANLYLAKNYKSQNASIQTVIENYKKATNLQNIVTYREFAAYLYSQSLYQQCIDEYQQLLALDASQGKMDGYISDSFRLISIILDNNLQIELIPTIFANLQNQYNLIPSNNVSIDQKFAELNMRYIYISRIKDLDNAEDKKAFLDNLKSDLDTIAQKFNITRNSSLLYDTFLQIISKRLYELYEEQNLSKADRDAKRNTYVESFNNIIDKDLDGVATQFAKKEI